MIQNLKRALGCELTLTATFFDRWWRSALLSSTERGIAELKLFLSCGASLQSLLARSFRSPASPFSYNTLMAEAARYVSLMWVFAEKRGLAEKLA